MTVTEGMRTNEAAMLENASPVKRTNSDVSNSEMKFSKTRKELPTTLGPNSSKKFQLKLASGIN